MPLSGHGISGQVLGGVTEYSGISAGAGLLTSGKVLTYDFANDQRYEHITYTGGANGTYFDATGTLQTSATNTPRFDHNPATLVPLGLMIEKERENLCLQSEDLSTTWSTIRASISADDAVAPDGNVAMDKIVEDDTVTNTHYARQSLSFTSGVTYSISCFAKADGRDLRISFPDAAFPANPIATYDLDLGTVSAEGSGIDSSSIQSIGSGIYRCTVTATADATIADFIIFYLINEGTFSYTGDTVSGVHIWGVQMEVGTFPTSYIATTTAAVTRTAEAPLIALTDIPGFSATEGTVFAEVLHEYDLDTSATDRVFDISDGTATNRISARAQESVDAWLGSVIGDTGGNSIGPSFVAGQHTKIAMAWALNDMTIAANGSRGALDVTVVIPTGLTTFYVGVNFEGLGNHFNGHISHLTYWPQRLPDADLTALTV